MAKYLEPRRQLSRLEKIGIGMAVGFVAPFVLPLVGGSLPPNYFVPELRAVLLFSPVFGGAMAYFLDRHRSIERSHGDFLWMLAAGTLAGGFTSVLAFDLGYLSALWQVLLGFVGGALVVMALYKL